MTQFIARTLSFTFAPALIALVGFSSSSLAAIEPQDLPAKPALVRASVDAPAASAEDGKKHSAKKHRKHHHHKGQAGRK